VPSFERGDYTPQCRTEEHLGEGETAGCRKDGISVLESAARGKCIFTIGRQYAFRLSTSRAQHRQLLAASSRGLGSNRGLPVQGERRQAASEVAALKLAVAFAVVLVIFGLRGSSVDSLAYLTGAFVVVGFAGYEAWRLYVRRANPLPAYKR
jgi:hypothetical protein